MAEWILLIVVVVIVVGAYWLNLRFFETWQVASIWVGAGLLLTIGLIVYISSKVDRASSSWGDRYNIEAEP